jgi:hypothetical protein
MISSPHCATERWFSFCRFIVIRNRRPIARRNKQSGCNCQPWFYLRLAAYSFFWLSEGAYGYSRDLVHKALFSLTRLWMLTLEPERRKITAIAEMNLQQRFLRRRSSCLLLQKCSVETHSFLPNQQSNCGNFTGQRQTRHRWLHSASHHGRVEILQRSGGDGRTHGGALKDVFQIVIVIEVESADRNGSLRSLELSCDVAIFAAGVRLQTETAVGPQLSLRSEAVRRLHQSNQ